MKWVGFLWISFVFTWQALANPVQFGYADVLKLLEIQNPASVEEFIRQLPVNVRSHFVLVHHSQSQDVATREIPRMIFSNDDATLLLAVSGHKDNPRGSFVEMIRFDRSSSRFIPTEIEFARSSQRQLDFVVRENPKSCYACHGTTSFHPNWRSYDFWPGFFGSAHAGGVPQRPKAQLAYWKFLAEQRHLDNERLSLLTSLPLSVGKLASRNSQLTTHLARLNVERVAKDVIVAMEGHIQFYPALLAALMNNKKAFARILQQLTPLKRDQISNEIKDYSSHFSSLLRDQCAEKIKFANQVDGFNGPTPFVHLCFDEELAPIFSMLQILNDRGVPLDFFNWSTTYKNSSLEFATPVGRFFTDVAVLVYEKMEKKIEIQKTLSNIHEFRFAKALQSQKRTVVPLGEQIATFFGLENLSGTNLCSLLLGNRSH